MEMPTFTTFQGNKVTSPNPSTTLTVGKPFLITWTNITGPPTTSQVTIYLLNSLDPTAKRPSDLSRNRRIATVENTGSYRWMVPRSIADKETYVIEMSYDSWMGNYSYSQPFAVMGAGVNTPTLPDYDTNVGLNWENSKAAVAAILAGVGLLVVAGTGYWIVNRRRNRAAEKRREEERRVREVKLGEMEMGGVSGRTSVDGTV
ncbi:hypothetical protein TWF569_009288 [Orbilia oligospora]|uniref:Yeast cell wall synthesis Kre9/Knh1-like N-terminal domain-containing protein n=1 Tax=Orbilia oligospora TaxID=2813651 RepID=A0A7C8MX66_ORBOL|nr:hypothetical protein TWF102_004776 [Orbilia oligospora]KAF3077915.1 hypothetical protein TWF706_004904 [Orbilia oligospora]KAF3081913.1 hypothetical protein TWF103_003601 [Orbilia oligospora]KAF3129851.1 hypothetical protein TWF594_010617 [Orbilia oligospora]KAF3137359.1 hypothetical protein TWF569_009288 [Orbilia oligospora]